MIKRLSDFLAGLPMTIAAGVFLLLDLIPHLMEEFGGTPTHLSFLPFDPAWVTVVISGIPLLYLAVWRMIHNPGISKISSALLICIAMFAAIAIGDLFAAGEVAFIMAIGALLEEATTNRAKRGLKKLIRMVQDAENRQAPMQRIADKAASWLVPVALLIAIFSYVFTGNIITAVTVLVVFCPCALVLATPTAVMAAIGQATKHGVIIKSGEALEKMGRIQERTSPGKSDRGLCENKRSPLIRNVFFQNDRRQRRFRSDRQPQPALRQ